MILSNKAKQINPSITLAITAKAKELKDEGIDIVSFGAGEPDFNTPQNIINASIRAMEDGKTKYTPASGILELREEIAKKLLVENNLKYDSNQIVVSTGAKQALANAFMAILNPGDEVIVPTPYWVSYPELVALADGKTVFVENLEKDDYKYTIDSLNKVVTEKTKAILINSPNNPTGTIYTGEELKEIAEFAKANDLIIISDEIYEKLIYGENKHISIASISEDSYKRTIVINGFSKSYAMTGWRLGYLAASKEIAKFAGSIQSHMTSNTSSITQYAAYEALKGPQDEIEQMIKEFEKRRNFMIERLDSIDNLKYIKPEGAFYVMVNIKEFLNKSINNKSVNNSLEFAAELLEEEKVAVIPGAAFGLEGYIRLSYATSIELIKEGIDRIETFLKKLK